VYPQAPIQSGTNVVQTETFDWQTGVWTDNGPNAQQSLPLFPRMHLLPNGDVFYDAGGQTFNPFGQAYDEALWNIVSAYHPSTQSWTDLGYAGLPLQLNQVGLNNLTSALLASNPNFPALTAATISAVLSTLVGQPISSSAQLASLLGAIVGPGGADTILSHESSQALYERAGEPKTIKNRLHLDLRPKDQAAEVARLEALGARRVDVGQRDVSWVVLADPDGNEFDVLKPLAPEGEATG